MKAILALSFVILGLTVRGLDSAVSSNVDDLQYHYYPSPVSRYLLKYNDPVSFNNAPLKTSEKTMIIIDGFLSNGSSPMSQTLKNGYLQKDIGRNTIVLNWGKLSGNGNSVSNIVETGLLYGRVLDNIGPVGRRLAEFIHYLGEEEQVDPSNVHIVGHSLGAHVAGAAGLFTIELYGQKIGRISGLDPAGPFFEQESDPRYRLDKSDADFVDIYHTNRGDMGDSAHQTASVNLYINGGDNQPGCEEADQAGFKGFCSHSYSWKIFNEALSKQINACPCSGFGCQCKTCEGDCGAESIRIGDDLPLKTFGAYHVHYGPIA